MMIEYFNAIILEENQAMVGHWVSVGLAGTTAHPAGTATPSPPKKPAVDPPLHVTRHSASYQAIVAILQPVYLPEEVSC